MIVGEVHPLSAVEGETGCVLEETQQDTRAFYIISLGREGGRGRGVLIPGLNYDNSGTGDRIPSELTNDQPKSPVSSQMPIYSIAGY